MSQKKLSIYFWLVISIISWGSSFVAVKIGLDGLNPYELASYRFTVASIALIPIALLNKFKFPKWKDFKLILALAIFGVYAYHISLNYATLNFSPNSVSFISNSSPIFITIFAIIFLNEKVKLLGWIGLILSMIGVYAITISGATFELSTDLVALLLIPIFWGAFFILQKPLLGKLKPLEIMSYSIWIGTILFLLTSHSFIFKLAEIPKTTHIAVIYLGIFPTVIAYLSWSIVLSRITVSRASSFSYLVPIVTIIVSIFLINEKPSLSLIIGGIFILLGVYFVNASEKKHRSKSKRVV